MISSKKSNDSDDLTANAMKLAHKLMVHTQVLVLHCFPIFNLSVFVGLCC
jgi:hypothetical protein